MRWSKMNEFIEEPNTYDLVEKLLYENQQLRLKLKEVF